MTNVVEPLTQKYARLAKTQPGVSRVGWRDNLQQALQFEVMLDFALPTDASVLDVGCGVGDFLATLEYSGFSGPYTGIDLLPDFIAEAESRFADRAETQFWVGDLLDYPEKSFDYVFASGLFDYKVENSLVNWQKTLAYLIELTQKGVVFNGYFQTPLHRADMWAVDLEQMIPLCRSDGLGVKLRVDYAPGHFTAFVFKQGHWITPQMQTLIGHVFLDRSLMQNIRESPQAMAAKYGVTLQQLNLLDSI